LLFNKPEQSKLSGVDNKFILIRQLVKLMNDMLKTCFYPIISRCFRDTQRKSCGTS